MKGAPRCEPEAGAGLKTDLGPAPAVAAALIGWLQARMSEAWAG